MLILDTSENAIERAAEIIREGGLAAFPTETVYGLGADAFNAAALARVFEAKKRPRFDPLIVHVADFAALERPARLSGLGAKRRALAEKLAAAFWPGPLTLVLPKQADLPGLATSDLPSVAVRVPSHPAALQLIRLAGKPGVPGAVAAPSANPFGRLSPTRAEHVIEGLGGAIDCVIDGGPCQVGVESTVLDIASSGIRILRPGGISREELERVTGPLDEGPGDGDPACSPGMLKSHYAPLVPLMLHTENDMARLSPRENEAYLFLRDPARRAWLRSAGSPSVLPSAYSAALSETGSAREAAANLFDLLHRLEALRPACIHAELLPEDSGLSAAVNDRLRRAAATG